MENPSSHKDNYLFLDCGDQKRLESIDGKTFVRQAPQANYSPSPKVSWTSPDYEFNSAQKSPSWTPPLNAVKTLPDFHCGTLVMEIRLSENGQIGVYPEQKLNWDWLNKVIANAQRPLRILNGFAYTGGSSIVCAQALGKTDHSEVCHLDASSSAVNWAKINRDKSGLPDDSIRFIVDDIRRFLEREIRRGKFYDGVILDPPAFGRAKGGKTWVLKRDLSSLMDLCRQILVPNPAFFLLSCHDPEMSKGDLEQILAETLKAEKSEIETIDLTLNSHAGNSLPNGIAARWRA
ncbi:hypothetical protein EXM22_04020 [Oceanispirochaeta crateris]|uniref:S-adenosylmethionine-dependent methyltransferase domain-containing protein n=1 Tax=Oceanispirochaeta crateris TaxID=2518645 RepID=A0A5C1QKY5_9SPIO|nr:class I SAM-dependent methyltransferase [Oceanispirochaeta crateris]QEN07196.1 hypothetical protein EXM22_04020 [Oceanispirochaeta crateris]